MSLMKEKEVIIRLSDNVGEGGGGQVVKLSKY